MMEETEGQRQEDTYLLKLRRRALFPGASSTMTIAESLCQLGADGYVRRLERELKRDGYQPWQYGGLVASERGWAELILQHARIKA
jgi:hypothetical protein